MDSPKPLPPLETLRNRFSIDPETGVLTYSVDLPGVRKGDIVCEKSGELYPRTTVNGQKCKLHRIAFALYHGYDPYPFEVDHINRDTRDNRKCNLRQATRSEQNKNRDFDGMGPFKKRPVKITYPGIPDPVIVESVREAASILGTKGKRLTSLLNGTRKSPRKDGVKVEYVDNLE